MRFLVLAFLFALLVAIFALQNSLSVTVSFMNWSFATSLVIIILGAAIFGALTMFSLAGLVQIRLRHTLQREKQKNIDLEAEISTLKNNLERELAKDLTNNDI
jgi:lipopolysaccharide assembly protein A